MFLWHKLYLTAHCVLQCDLPWDIRFVSAIKEFQVQCGVGKIEIKYVCKQRQLLPVRILCSGAFANCEKKKRLLASSCLSVRPSVLMEQLRSHWRFYIKLEIRVFFENLSRKFKKNWYFTWRPIYILIICLSILLRKRNVSDKSCRKNQNTFYVR